MAILEKYLENNDWNNRLIQRTLRDIDTQVCLEVMAGLDAASLAAIERNLSKRAAVALHEDLAEQKDRLSDEVIAASTSLFLRRLAMYERYESAGLRLPDSWNDAAASSQDWYGNLLYLADCHAKDDYSRLQAIREKTGHRLLRLALQCLIDGSDPLEARARLETMQDSMLEDYRRQLRLIVEATDSMLNRELPGKTAEKLACHLPENGLGS